MFGYSLRVAPRTLRSSVSGMRIIDSHDRGYMQGGIHDAALSIFLACGAGFPACPRLMRNYGLLSMEGWGG